jgi:uncharacterized damage-inducible protein DinB
VAEAFDRATLVELFDYTTFTWSAYGNAVRALPPGALQRPIEGSGWPDLRTPLFHLASAWDDWLRDRLAIDDPLAETPDAMASWDDIAFVRARNRGWLRRILDETPDDALHEDIVVWRGTPAEMRATPAQVLAHILVHERGHHGDVGTLIERLGGTPPAVDYLVYRWFKQRSAG